MRRLAQPNLVALSGQTASFHAGGEVPIQSVTNSGGAIATSTDYRPYGVRLTFTPTVLDDGLINLQIEPEVSEIDPSVNVNGNPGFTSRAAKTTVQLRNGQSFALAGLLQATNSREIDQLPWLGNVPVLGALFRSTSFQKNEFDLVIIVTPHLVQPGNPAQVMATPLDQTRSSNDVELFALGLLEVNKRDAPQLPDRRGHFRAIRPSAGSEDGGRPCCREEIELSSRSSPSRSLASGCADYMNRWDTISFGAGNASAANEGIQTIKPFPREAWNQHIDSDGKVVLQDRAGLPVRQDLVLVGPERQRLVGNDIGKIAGGARARRMIGGQGAVEGC